jgi:hypothetical protein
MTTLELYKLIFILIVVIVCNGAITIVKAHTVDALLKGRSEAHNDKSKMVAFSLARKNPKTFK